MPRTAEPLRRSLGPAGRGYKDYTAVFSNGRRMRISATPSRRYADLVGPDRVGLYRLIGSVVTPGMRVLDLAGGTGDGPEWLASRVGPSGGVVSLERDAESVRYARRRYHVSHISHEIDEGWALSGEADGAFDAVVLVDPAPRPPQIARLLAEAARLVGPGGAVAIALPSRDADLARVARELLAAGSLAEESTDGGWRMIMRAEG